MPAHKFSIGDRVVLSEESMRSQKRPRAYRSPDVFRSTRTLESNAPRLVTAISLNARYLCFDYKGEMLWFPVWACETVR